MAKTVPSASALAVALGGRDGVAVAMVERVPATAASVAGPRPGPAAPPARSLGLVMGRVLTTPPRKLAPGHKGATCVPEVAAAAAVPRRAPGAA